MEVHPSRATEIRGQNHVETGESISLGSPNKKNSFERNQMPDVKISHQKFMAVYKVNECKKKFNHDKRQCPNWHSQADRRRNPFHISYSTIEVR